ncbi:hypothetical protein [Streptomyces anulatus]|uniref:hypothetical protein n=1 Tax=Streptomyces anulatus TaxID=1892 RepID=UPI001C27654A|nr:hypothetical protein [Streptomyces anulatus]
MYGKGVDGRSSLERSFVDVTDPGRLPEYHDWQLYDHVPENRALRGVACGDRWTRIPGAVSVERLDERFTGVDSLTMHWFLPPYEESVAEWNKLGVDSVQWGRGPGIPGVVRPFIGHFDTVKGYAAPRSLVTPRVLPHRPNHGLHVTLTNVDDPLGPEAHLRYQREDRGALPGLLAVYGVVGAWTFSLRESPGSLWNPSGDDTYEPHDLRLRILYLDDVPGHGGRTHRRDGGGAEVDGKAEVLFAAPLASCAPAVACPSPAPGFRSAGAHP